MGMSGSKKARRKAVREGKLNPEALRSEWVRKPYTQVQPNTKADQRRSFCRKPGTSEGADPFYRRRLLGLWILGMDSLRPPASRIHVS